jgi:glutathione S-transferase
MYTVIGAPKTRAYRVIWMLEELGQPYAVNPVRPHDAALAAITPSGKVPILQDGTDYVTDSVAICQYLADKHGDLTFPAGTIARAHQDSFTQFAVDDLESCLWTAAKHTFVLPEALRVDAVKPACKHGFERGLDMLGQRLGGKTYVMGETFTVPDLLIGHCLGWGRSMGWTIPDGAVSAYSARLRDRPAMQRANAVRDKA